MDLSYQKEVSSHQTHANICLNVILNNVLLIASIVYESEQITAASIIKSII